MSIIYYLLSAISRVLYRPKIELIVTENSLVTATNMMDDILERFGIDFGAETKDLVRSDKRVKLIVSADKSDLYRREADNICHYANSMYGEYIKSLYITDAIMYNHIPSRSIQN